MLIIDEKLSKANIRHLNLSTKSTILTLEYRIVVGLRLFINQIFFENVDEKKKSKNDRNA